MRGKRYELNCVAVIKSQAPGGRFVSNNSFVQDVLCLSEVAVTASCRFHGQVPSVALSVLAADHCWRVGGNLYVYTATDRRQYP